MHRIHYSSLISITLFALLFIYGAASSQTTTTPIIAVGTAEIVPNQPITVPITLANFDQTGVGSIMLTIRYDSSSLADVSCMTDPADLFQLDDCAIHPSGEGTVNEALFTLVNGQNILTDTTTILGSMVFTATDQVSGAVALGIEVREFADLDGNAVATAISTTANVTGTKDFEYMVYLPVINR